jgi:hypothetical protein
MKPAFWIGLGLDGLGAVLLVIGIFLVLEPVGVPLIMVSVALMIGGTFLSIGSSMSSSFGMFGRAGDGAGGFSWVTNPMGQANAGMAMGTQMVGAMNGVSDKRMRLAQTGVVGDATVVQARNTGLTAGSGSALVDLDLNITLTTRAPYTFALREAVHPSALGQLVPGKALKVKVDPANDLDVIVDWTASGLPIPV